MLDTPFSTGPTAKSDWAPYWKFRTVVEGGIRVAFTTPKGEHTGRKGYILSVLSTLPIGSDTPSSDPFHFPPLPVYEMVETVDVDHLDLEADTEL